MMLFVPPDPWSDNIGIGSGFSVFSFRGNVFIPCGFSPLSSVVLGLVVTSLVFPELHIQPFFGSLEAMHAGRS